MPFIDTHAHRSELNLPVELSGMTVTVPSATFLWEGEEKRLSEAESFTVAEQVRSLSVYVVADTEQEDAVHILVDALEENDYPYIFEKGGRYRLLTILMWGNLPEGVGDLSEVDFNILRALPMPKKLKEGE